MPYLLTIQFPADREALSKDRVLDVGEALERALHRVAWADTDINDRRRLWNELIVEVHDEAKIAPAYAEIQKALAANRLEDFARIRRQRVDAARQPPSRP